MNAQDPFKAGVVRDTFTGDLARVELSYIVEDEVGGRYVRIRRLSDRPDAAYTAPETRHVNDVEVVA
jgi:hypothetical protein